MKIETLIYLAAPDYKKDRTLSAKYFILWHNSMHIAPEANFSIK